MARAIRWIFVIVWWHLSQRGIRVGRRGGGSLSARASRSSLCGASPRRDRARRGAAGVPKAAASASRTRPSSSGSSRHDKMVRPRGPLAAWHAAEGPGAVLALAHADLYRRSALPRPHRAVDRRQGSEPRGLRHLGRDRTRPDADERRHHQARQSRHPQERQGGRGAEEQGACSCRPAVPISTFEMAFSKLKAHLRRVGARTFDALWKANGGICDLFSPRECCN